MSPVVVPSRQVVLQVLSVGRHAIRYESLRLFDVIVGLDVRKDGLKADDSNVR